MIVIGGTHPLACCPLNIEGGLAIGAFPSGVDMVWRRHQFQRITKATPDCYEEDGNRGARAEMWLFDQAMKKEVLGIGEEYFVGFGKTVAVGVVGSVMHPF